MNEFMDLRIFLLCCFCYSIVGGILLVGGLYSVLWGKSKEAKIASCGKVNAVDDDDNGHHKPQEEEPTTASIVEQV
jgi:hypothetical protein